MSQAPESAALHHRRTRLVDAHPEWVPRTLAGHLDEAVRRFADRPFIFTETRTFSYRQLRAWACRLAKGLVASGVRPGEHVGLVLANYPEFIAAKFAISYAGAVAVPINFLLRERELGYVLRQSDVVSLLTMSRFRDLDYRATLDAIAPGWATRGGGAQLPCLRDVVVFDPAGAALPEGRGLADLEAAGQVVSDAELAERSAAVAPDAVCDVIYTSGTTGQPKGAMLTHENLLRCAFSSVWIRGFGDGRRVLFALPLYHVFAYVEGLLAVMWVGGAVIPQTVFDAEETLAAIQRHQADEALFVPTMTIAVVEHPGRASYDLSSLGTVMSAAAPAPVRLWRQVQAELGVREVTTAYGQTEVAASSTYTHPGDPIELVATTVGRPKPGSVAGSPALGGLVCDYKTVDPFGGADLPPGTEGELVVRGPQVMAGYYHKPEETAAVLDAGGWLRSGDLGRIREDGYVVLTGRSKELYKCGGELVAPKEIEDLLTSRPEVSQAYVVGVPDERMGEVGCAFVVPAPGAHLDTGELLALCRANLARFKVPVAIFERSAAELPTTATGKVQKFQLAQDGHARLTGDAR